ncbi:phosphatidate cytidylyltransferase [Bisgaard Taxon 10/6]|uniref:Phosphatidate cytidylyltransferase n=1 Tax=Exercitatus varius TaxID=67857 RepID=A0ABT6EN07_9PAST|nr:phosphatidate cytidylyltransferase [Exercitatus varius]QOF67969.1 phosphatidate cytidylyltransferase [Actinobacillus sp. GY-402]MDG2939492.1 phosphatidate cytidylyltransferase [Exercitatus varius]MDG2944918.1 phosphatidate cytidylyltransferase [Exercitatus varius]MDG2947065.1 phosphatidate cytidylyltransferase [Exercitatus varius]MDG2955800.1 phosphatidate cytidylyltransferase [Exercitatus varius]
MLKERVLSAIVLIAIVCAALFLFSPFYFALTLGAVVALGVWEWTQFPRFNHSVWRFSLTAIASAFLFLWIYSQASYLNAGKVFAGYAQPILLFAVIWWFAAFFLVIGYPKSAAIWRKSVILQLLFAFLTLVPFLVGVLKLRLDQYTADSIHGIQLLLYVFVLVWAADSGAYFAGRKFGKHKLAPKVSPGKTWQGVIGGLITACILAALFIHFAGDSLFSHGTLPSLTALSVATVAVSVLGDLTESMFKRESGIKDSGNLIPGHGGVLDRIDSLTAATPFFAYFYFFVL